MDKNKSLHDKKIIILGFDGMDPGLVETMMKDGELPNFSSLKEKGSYKRIATTNPPQSPVAWTAFATGQNPGKNGVFDFIIRDPKNYGLTLSLSDFRHGVPVRPIKTKCFWEYLSAKNIPSVIINCPVTFPPHKLRGKMLSGMGVPDILGTEGTFTFYTTESAVKSKDIGGNVFYVNAAPVMVLNFIGPRVAAAGSKADNTKVPFKVTLQRDKDGIAVEYQNNRFELKKGEWSPWKKVTFDMGLFRQAKGIYKFYLAETHPHFKLYMSPVNFDPESPFVPISYPKNYSRELAGEIGLYATQGMPMDTWAVNEKRLPEKAFLEDVNRIFEEKKSIFDHELRQFKKGVFFFYFEATDIIQHMFWRYIDPGHPFYKKDSPAEYREMVKTWYKKMDEVLGRAMASAGGEDTLIVLSDHGFSTFRRAAHINSWLRKNGYLELKNNYKESGAELLRDIDWAKTRAYAIGFGAVYVNQKGREHEGIVSPGRETEMLKDEISKKLKDWRDEKYGALVVKNVYKNEEIFRGDNARLAPDLYIGFNTGYRASWQTALGAAPGELIEDNLKEWSGDHLFDPQSIPGVVFSSKVIAKENPSLYDIAPTILKACGFDYKKLDLDGEPLF